jgi:hypothetical protein
MPSELIDLQQQAISQSAGCASHYREAFNSAGFV